MKDEAEKERPGDAWTKSKEPKSLEHNVLITFNKLGKFRYEKPLPEEFNECRFFTA